MMRIILSVTVFALMTVFLMHGATRAEWHFDVETGAAINGYNDVQIPGDSGTRFSLSEELDSDPVLFWRLRISRDLGEKHYLSLLIAPLRLESEGSFDRVVSFASVDFPANADIKARYRFDSYRLTYRYRLYQNEKLHAGLGLTAKIRDAEISLSEANRKASKANTGFVPLINLKLHWQFNKKLGILFEGDGLAAPQGRAEDFLLAGLFNLNEKLGLKLGYRFLEGGADNDEVYNFTLVNYVVIGATLIL
ncbi:MAG: hypothetical protein JSU85_14990 [Candidatus Zixiibacteriota bacterium]|nr:MAG: hypothetical protein JSU85_14990 [candidate division Zixibacteria bacterium]